MFLKRQLLCGLSFCTSQVTTSPRHPGLGVPLARARCPEGEACKRFTEGAMAGEGHLLVCAGSRHMGEGCWGREIARRRNLGWEVHQGASCHTAPTLWRVCSPRPPASTFSCKAELPSLFFPSTVTTAGILQAILAEQPSISEHHIPPVAINPGFVSSAELSHFFPPLLI